MGKELVKETIDNTEYIWHKDTKADTGKSPHVLFLPNYDEYIVAYSDRSHISGTVNHAKLDARQNFLFNHTLVIDGIISGIWRKKETKKKIILTITPFHSVSATVEDAIHEAAATFKKFYDLPIELVIE